MFKDWNGHEWGAHEDNCDDFEGRVEFMGDYEYHRCGIRLAEARPEDSGEWRCSLRSYYDKSDWAERTFRVAVTTNFSIGW